MKAKFLVLGLIIALAFGAANAIEYSCDATSFSNPISVPEDTSKAWVIENEYSRIPIIIPFDGRPVIFPINDSALSVVPFDGGRPRIYGVVKVIEIPVEIFDDVKIKDNNKGDIRVIFVPYEGKTLIIKLTKTYIELPHGDELSQVIGTTNKDLLIQDSLMIPIKNLADEPVVIELDGDKLIIPLEGGGPRSELLIENGDAKVFTGNIRTMSSLSVFIGYDVKPLFVHIKDTGLLPIDDLINGLLKVKDSCCLIPAP
ncbi:MAG: hypothetical protein J7K22_03010 [Nanoarchaeota archaeon]|nr:hypothetical protein [Nanoarchaeota archaeon]